MHALILVVACPLAVSCGFDELFSEDSVPTAVENPEKKFREFVVEETFADEVEYHTSHVEFRSKSEQTLRIYYQRVKSIQMWKMRKPVPAPYQVEFKDYDGVAIERLRFGFEEEGKAKSFVDLATTVIKQRRD